MHPPPPPPPFPNFETLIGKFKVDKRNFELKVRNSKLKLQKIFQILEYGLFFKFGVIDWFAKQITKFIKRKFQGTSENFNL